jgi:hypothetical protein
VHLELLGHFQQSARLQAYPVTGHAQLLFHAWPVFLMWETCLMDGVLFCANRQAYILVIFNDKWSVKCFTGRLAALSDGLVLCPRLLQRRRFKKQKMTAP